MEPQDLEKALAEQGENINALKENQFALVAQVQVLQAALASSLMHHPDKKAVLAAFERYMQVARDSAPSMATRMDSLAIGVAAVLGKHQA
jgi:hypothetical protein